MLDVERLGWRAALVGELDHRHLKAPSVKLRSARQTPHGDAIYCVDLRVRRPNADACLTTTELHSLEHFLLEGLQRELPETFVSVGIMGCRTGFYLVFVNEGRAQAICAVLARILTDLQAATAVPYARIDQCGHFRDHGLAGAQRVAREILARRSAWLDAA
ncbi:MAG TPA: S-ribosylhomocysteine lyase [Rhodanobacteraceae bacterium]|nr:S-ribosylhomocysteine lyase [Rhodanobacteraceae bacterium]